MDRLIFLPFSINGQKRRNKKKGDIQYSLPKEAEKKKRKEKKGDLQYSLPNEAEEKKRRTLTKF